MVFKYNKLPINFQIDSQKSIEIRRTKYFVLFGFIDTELLNSSYELGYGLV